MYVSLTRSHQTRSCIEKGNDVIFVYEKGTRSLRNVLHASAYVTCVAEGKGPNYLLGCSAICFDSCLLFPCWQTHYVQPHELDESFIYLSVVDARRRSHI